jgi:hypothetical protein
MAIQPTMPRERFEKKFGGGSMPEEPVALLSTQCHSKSIQIFEPNRIRRIVMLKENIHLFLDGGVEFSMPYDENLIFELSQRLQIPLDYFNNT